MWPELWLTPLIAGFMIGYAGHWWLTWWRARREAKRNVPPF